MLTEIIKGFIVLTFIFVPLETLFSVHRHFIFRPGWKTDLAYFFIGHFIGKYTTLLISVLFTFSWFAHGWCRFPWQNYITSQPILLQLIEAIITADLAYYIAHKLLHTIPGLWKFHAVHHSVEYLDWLATVRVHPVDQIFTRICQMLPLLYLGFTTPTLAIYALYSSIIAFFIHANIRLKLGILKWFIASPQFHHWHHAKAPQIGQKNFAAQVPLLDLLLGTLYLPYSKMPHQYGIADQVPSGYCQQLMYPFQRSLNHVD